MPVSHVGIAAAVAPGATVATFATFADFTVGLTAAPTDDADMPAASSSPTATARPVFATRRAGLPRRRADLHSSGVRTERSLLFSGVGQELVLVLQSALPPDA